MGVHDLASYVKYHQEKLRTEQALQDAASAPSPVRAPRRGVNSVNSKADFLKAVNEQVNTQGASESGKLIFLDAFATWCGPCKMIAPTIANWSEGKSADGKSEDTRYADKVAFYKFDVDAVPDLAQELGVRAMPTFFLFKQGETEPIGEIVGANPREIEKGLDAALEKLSASE